MIEGAQRNLGRVHVVTQAGLKVNSAAVVLYNVRSEKKLIQTRPIN